MKQRVLFSILTVLLGCAASQVKADPVVTTTHGSATLEANARLVTGAPATSYSYHAPYNAPSSNTAAVTIGSTHYAKYSVPSTTAVSVNVNWYFRNTVQVEVVDSGSVMASISSTNPWRKDVYLEHTENLTYGNYTALATSTVNDDLPNYGAGPYAYESRQFVVNWVGP